MVHARWEGFPPRIAKAGIKRLLLTSRLLGLAFETHTWFATTRFHRHDGFIVVDDAAEAIQNRLPRLTRHGVRPRARFGTTTAAVVRLERHRHTVYLLAIYPVLREAAGRESSMGAARRDEDDTHAPIVDVVPLALLLLLRYLEIGVTTLASESV